MSQLKRFKYNGCCPLTSRTYGLDPYRHSVRHVPCTRHTAPINLCQWIREAFSQPDFLFADKHFIQYHHLTHSAAMRIVRLIANGKDERDVDLFSRNSNSLIAMHPTIYRAQCPLNAYGRFGITAEHNIRLCSHPTASTKDVCLYDHFGQSKEKTVEHFHVQFSLPVFQWCFTR